MIKEELEWQGGTVSQSPFSWMLRGGDLKGCIDVLVSIPIGCTVVGFIGQHFNTGQSIRKLVS